MTTLAQFRTAVATEIGLDNSTSGDQTLIDSWVNEGVTDVLKRTSCRQRSGTLTLTAGTADYTLDTTIMRIFNAYVTSGGINYWLEEISVDDLLAMRRASSSNVSPAQYYAVAGADLFLIYPTPAAADTVSIYYVPRPTVLSVSSDSPSEIPAEFHNTVEFYAEARAASMSDDAGSQMGNFYLGRYEQEIKRMRRLVQLKGNHRMPLASRRSAVSRMPFHDRSTYP